MTPLEMTRRTADGWHSKLRKLGLVMLCCLAATTSCRRAPSRPDFNPTQSATDAIAKYDTNGDGKLESSEYAACPGLVIALPRIDKDSDKTVTADEIAERVRYYIDSSTAVISGSLQVTFKGQPLTDATVIFDPEPFLGPEFQPCNGTTDARGEAFVSRDTAEFPGLYLGFYRVRISKLVAGKELIPAKYNVNTELGFEAANDIPGVSNVIQFHLAP